MPIYAYRCAACGHAKDVLQKISDPPLADCPACGASRFEKQVTAAGFQLKGSGWYVTDFRNNGSAKSDAKSDAKADAKAGSKTDDAKAADAKPAAEAPAAAPAAAPAPTPAAAPPPAASSS
jgi:putative FmdB family regulatory protein